MADRVPLVTHLTCRAEFEALLLVVAPDVAGTIRDDDRVQDPPCGGNAPTVEQIVSAIMVGLDVWISPGGAPFPPNALQRHAASWSRPASSSGGPNPETHLMCLRDLPAIVHGFEDFAASRIRSASGWTATCDRSWVTGELVGLLLVAGITAYVGTGQLGFGPEWPASHPFVPLPTPPLP